MKRTGFQPRQSPMPRKRAKPRRTSAPEENQPNIAPKVRKAHMARVAALCCIACLMDGNAGTPPELHHPRSGAGAGQKSSDMDVIPLCPPHHRGTDHPRTPSIHLDRLKFIARYGTEAGLLARVRAMIGEEE